MISLSNHYPTKGPQPHFPLRAHLSKHRETQNKPLKLTMALNFFDQFASPSLYGIPLIALALTLP